MTGGVTHDSNQTSIIPGAPWSLFWLADIKGECLHKGLNKGEDKVDGFVEEDKVEVLVYLECWEQLMVRGGGGYKQ